MNAFQSLPLDAIPHSGLRLCDGTLRRGLTAVFVTVFLILSLAGTAAASPGAIAGTFSGIQGGLVATWNGSIRYERSPGAGNYGVIKDGMIKWSIRGGPPGGCTFQGDGTMNIVNGMVNGEKVLGEAHISANGLYYVDLDTTAVKQIASCAEPRASTPGARTTLSHGRWDLGVSRRKLKANPEAHTASCAAEPWCWTAPALLRPS